MSIFLSIDLDYWSVYTTYPGLGKIPRFLEDVLRLPVPIMVAREHHHLIDWTNQFPCTTLVNIDQHSDIGDIECARHSRGLRKLDDFNDGTWVNFVSWRRGNTYEWRYPKNSGIDCHSIHDPFEHENQGRFGWKKVMKRTGLSAIPLNKVQAIGLCFSPAYWYDEEKDWPGWFGDLIGHPWIMLRRAKSGKYTKASQLLERIRKAAQHELV